MNIFFAPDITGRKCVLDEIESKHCTRVLRLTTGENINLIDGKGGLYTGIIADSNPKKCLIEITGHIPDFEKKNYRLHVAIAPTKNIDRFEWFIEKAVEIGVDEITPLICEHSERRILNPDRLEKIIISAMKQSLKAYKPVLNNLINFDAFCRKTVQGEKFIAHCEDGPKFFFGKEIIPCSEYVVLIGPEGDFSANEIEQAKASGCLEISLGNSRLRTETAGVVACAIAAMVNTD
ncbi:MAG: 16S rRNA (uracil(1498)-N(3))-methyltransferase [Prolixibacteraceae bacterium]|nr:16S rRNA (uracil(1498)-N(3))-methyltransferase [Prolixibacteraceae bacterium]